MIVSVFRRRLKQGVTFEDFREAWEADRGFGVPTRVFNAVRLDDEREILTFGIVDVEPGDLAEGLDAVADQEAVRHSRIDDVIESTELKAMYELVAEHDFTDEPRRIPLDSSESLLAAMR